jgi:hypothetical protein
MENRNPLLYYGDVDNLSTWGGTATRTTGETDPFGGTEAVGLGDNSGVVDQSYNSPAMTDPGGSIELLVAIRRVSGTQPASVVFVQDATAGVDRGGVTINWDGSGNVTSVSVFGNGVAAVLVGSMGNGWWLVWFRGTGLFSANNNHLYVYPAPFDVARTGKVALYLRPCVVPGWFDNVLSWPKPAEGSELRRLPGGAADSWITGTDQFLRGDVRWVPTITETVPAFSTGWDGGGVAQVPAVLVGWVDFLANARAGKAVRWVPNRNSAIDRYRDVVLVEPFLEEPDQETDGSRRLRLVFASVDGSPFKGY